MGAYPVYYVEESDTLPHLFASFDGGTGASITLTGLAVTDIEIFKDGGATARSSDSGYTLLDTDGIDFASITGVHGFSIDLSDNTDAGFYAVGSWYHVVVSSVTIDGQTVSFVACAFRIVSATRGMAGTALPAVAANASGGVVTFGTGSGQLNVAGGLAAADVQAISGDATAADNAEAAFDGTGYTFAACTFPWTAAWDAEVQSECADALVAIELDHLMSASGTFGTNVADNSIIALMCSTSGLAAGFVNSTDSLQALRDRGDAAWVTSTLTTAGIADAVWDEATAGHVAAGSFGKLAADVLADTGTDGVVVAAASKTGYSLLSTGLDLVTAWTVAITGNITGNLSGSVGSVTGAVGSVTGAVGSVTGNVGGNVTGSIGSLAAQAKADVNAEADTAISDWATSVLPDSVSTDGTRPTMQQAVYLIHQMLTEFAISSTTLTVKKVDGSTTLATFTLDDATSPTSLTRAS